eukprot:1084824-Pyramimonas_sp.AAC.1
MGRVGVARPAVAGSMGGSVGGSIDLVMAAAINPGVGEVGAGVGTVFITVNCCTWGGGVGATFDCASAACTALMPA